MKTRLLWIGSLVVCLLAVSGPAFAHHAWHGYDMDNLTTREGNRDAIRLGQSACVDVVLK